MPKQDWVQALISVEAPVVSLEGVLPLFRDFLMAAANLEACGATISKERFKQRLSKQWWAAHTKVVTFLLVTREVFPILKEEPAQIRYARSHIDSWETACDLRLWKTLCGRPHAVPVEKVEALKLQVRKVREFLENKK